MFQLLRDFVPQDSYRGSASGPHWGTYVPQIPWPCPHDCKIMVTPSDSPQQGAPTGTPTTQNASRKSSGDKEIRKWGGKFTFLFQGKIIKRIKPSKFSKTYLQTSLIAQFSHGDTPRPSLKRGRDRSRRRMRKEEGEVASWLS